MRRLLRISLLAAALMAVLCISALAADRPDTAGLYGFTPADGVNVTITPYTAESETPIQASNQGAGYETFYQNAARFDVTYTDDAIKAGEQYLLLVCSGTGAPDKSNIVYINQKASVAGKVEFTEMDRAYPSSLGKGDYRIYVVGVNSAYDLNNPTATFSYYQAYRLGDIDNSGRITAGDALNALQMAVGSGTWEDWQVDAADVDVSGRVTAGDALDILQAAVGLKAFD